MGEFSLLDDFAKNFSTDFIYNEMFNVAALYLGALSGVLMIIAISIRVFTSSLDTLSGNGRWTALIKAIAIWGTVLGAYFAFATLVTDLFSALYDWANVKGASGVALKELGAHIEDIDKAAEESQGLLSDALKFVPGVNSIFTLALLGRGVAYALFFLSAIGVVAVQVVMQLGQALGFAAAFIFGTVAIPLAISDKISILQGWGKFSATILAWPFVEALFMFFMLLLAAGLLNDGVPTVSSEISGDIAATRAYVYFSILNVVFIVILIASPFITMALINRSGSIAGLVSPFVGGALATTGILSNALLKSPAKAAANTAGTATATAVGSAAGNVLGKVFSSNSSPPNVTTPATNRAAPTAAKPVDVTDTAATARPTAAMSQAVAESYVDPTADAKAAEVESPPRPDPAKQAKRGAIINNLKKSRT